MAGRSERAAKLKEDAVSLAGSGKTEEALKTANQALSILLKEGDKVGEAELLCKVVVDAYVARGDGGKAVAAANQALAIAQKEKDAALTALAWFAVTTARFAAESADALEAAEKALQCFQDLKDKQKEAATQQYISQAYSRKGDEQAAITAAEEALKISKEIDDAAEIGASTMRAVEACISAERNDDALRIAQESMSLLGKTASGGRVTAMGAVVVAETAKTGPEAGLARVKTYIEECQATGDTRGEAAMLHKLACMTSAPDQALNSAQVALALAQKAGDVREELAIKKSLTDIYAAKGAVEKAPLRKEALSILAELAQDLEAKNSDKFDDNYKLLGNYMSALKQSDFEKTIFKVVAKDEKEYVNFLSERGIDIGEKEQVPTGVSRARPVPVPQHYMGFRIGGLGYGPRYRCCVPPYKKIEDVGSAVGVVQLQDCSDDWERELGYSPSMLDCTLQTAAATGHNV